MANQFNELMVPVKGGTVELRDYMNTNKWISSDYTLSDPGSNKQAITWIETVEPFLNGNMRARREPQDIDMEALIKLHGIKKTLMDLFIK